MKQTSTFSRPRPVIELDGTPFYVDAQWLYLLQVGNPENKIDMQDALCFNDHVELWYDPTSKNIYAGSYNKPPPDHILVYWFHSFNAIDPVGAVALLDELNPKWRMDARKHSLPIAEIAGKRFFVDKKYACFYEVNNCWNCISFKHLIRRKKTRGLLINLQRHNSVFPHELHTTSSVMGLPDQIIFATISTGKVVKKIIDSYLIRNAK